MSTPPIACVPSALTPAQRGRSRALRRRIAAATTSTVEQPDGYRHQLRNDDELFRDVSEWITLERRCCPFLSFELRWSPADGPSILLAGPEGTKEFLRAEVPELPTEPA